MTFFFKLISATKSIFSILLPHKVYLLNKVLLEMFYFWRRGKGNKQNIGVQDSEIVDLNGQRYVQKVTSELLKNHKSITNEIEGSGGKMYATDSVLCQVQSFCKTFVKNAGTDFSFVQKVSFQIIRPQRPSPFRHWFQMNHIYGYIE